MTCAVDSFSGCSDSEIEAEIGTDMADLQNWTQAVCGETPGCQLNGILECGENHEDFCE